METVDVKCPWCSAVLRVKSVSGMEGKNITCPNCKHTSPFTQFKVVVPKEEESITCFPGGMGNVPMTTNENLTIGRLVIPLTGIFFQLLPGKNIIGRKASASKANFQIETEDNKRMSREHLIIEVKRIPTIGFTHYVSLYKERVNKTFINSTELLWGDTLILQHGDIIKLPDTDLRFELPDEETTQI
ncbi:MAG: FHA domain-containing protein [Muribaculaceae bacterium]|nr:FHA domain-containing protein [Muribaculaceae bacterium]